MRIVERKVIAMGPPNHPAQPWAAVYDSNKAKQWPPSVTWTVEPLGSSCPSTVAQLAREWNAVSSRLEAGRALERRAKR